MFLKGNTPIKPSMKLLLHASRLFIGTGWNYRRTHVSFEPLDRWGLRTGQSSVFEAHGYWELD